MKLHLSLLLVAFIAPDANAQRLFELDTMYYYQYSDDKPFQLSSLNPFEGESINPLNTWIISNSDTIHIQPSKFPLSINLDEEVFINIQLDESNSIQVALNSMLCSMAHGFIVVSVNSKNSDPTNVAFRHNYFTCGDRYNIIDPLNINHPVHIVSLTSSRMND